MKSSTARTCARAASSARRWNLDLSILPKFETVFGVDHERTLNVRNNIAMDYLRLGQFREALETDERTLEDRRRILGPNDLFTLNSSNAVARDLRGLGLYQESLDIARRVVNAFEAVGGRENVHWLHACEGSPPRCARPAITGTRCRKASMCSSDAATTWAPTTCTRCGPPPT